MIDNKLEEIQQVLRELLELLQQEGDLHRFPGFEEAFRLAGLAAGDESTRGVLKKHVAGLYRGGSGTFNDYGIWRENYDERVKVNGKLDHLRLKLRELSDQL